MSEEDKVSLVMESNYSSSSELWLLRKERCQQSAHSYTDFGIKVVQDEFWDMLGSYSMMFYLLLEFHTADFKDGQHAFKVPNEQFPAVRKSDYHDMGKIEIFCVFVDVFQLHVAPRVVSHVMKHHHQLSQTVINLLRRFQLSSYQYLNRPILLQNLVKFVKNSLVILFLKLLPTFLLVLNSDRLLSFFGWKLLTFLSFLHFELIFDNIPLIMHLNSLLFVLNVRGLSFERRLELFHGFRSLTYFQLLFRNPFLLVRGMFCVFDFFCHCCCYIISYKLQR